MVNRLKKRLADPTVLDRLRDQIIRGDYLPGAQLPRFTELMKGFGVGSAAIQRAINTLQRDGFVTSRPRSGTFITERPPHLYRYALVLPEYSGQNRFFGALWDAAGEMQREDVYQMQVAHLLGLRHGWGLMSQGYQELVDDLHAERVAGIIFGADPGYLLTTPVVKQPGMPRVALMSSPLPARYGIMSVVTDYDSFIDKAVARLRERGCRRIAVVHLEGFDGEPRLTKALAAAGIEWPMHWKLGFSLPTVAHGVCNAVRLLLDRADKPDGLLVLNDNLFQATLTGVVMSGVQIPGELTVITHANFGAGQPGAVPVERLGFSPYQLLQLSIAMIHRRRLNQPVPGSISVPATFEGEPFWAPDWDALAASAVRPS